MITFEAKKYLTIREVARMTGLAYSRIYREVIKKKNIPSFRVGKTILIEESDIKKLIREN